MSNDEYLLNDIEKLGFINDGFIVLRNLIPKSLVNRALKTINVKL